MGSKGKISLNFFESVGICDGVPSTVHSSCCYYHLDQMQSNRMQLLKQLKELHEKIGGSLAATKSGVNLHLFFTVYIHVTSYHKLQYKLYILSER